MRISRWLLMGIGVLALAAPAWAADPAPVRTTPFPDVPRNHWAYNAVEELRQRGILRGYPQGSFTVPAAKPQKPRVASAAARRLRKQR
jgi:hypothetical protein